MEIIHNKVVKIISGPLGGLYRVILNEPFYDIAVLACLETNINDSSKNNSCTKKLPNPSAYKRNNILWLKQSEIIEFQENRQITEIDIQLSNQKLDFKLSTLENEIFIKRILSMKGFLSFENLKHRLLIDRNLGCLVKEAGLASGYSKQQIYKLFSKLCRDGFTNNALRPEYFLSGAPGVKKPCGPKQKKLGKRTEKEKIEIGSGNIPIIIQPGMTEDWSKLIIAADQSIPLPKPTMPTRSRIILNSAFVKEYVSSNGLLVPKDFKVGTYPNTRQIARVLKESYSSSEHFLHKTTQRNFTLNHRGLVGKSWEGVAGPGHTYSIDSTIGDVYLRSSLNPEWIVGRPIVYTIVDNWSTAIMGFYVCLSGPSWDMAKIALFCSVADPTLIADLRGVCLLQTLFPHPTLPAVLLGDRGEYLSAGASLTSFELKMMSLSYTPPYRGDLKGPVEVTHRIEKDEQYFFLPGAIDARRKEYELRKFDYKLSLLTVREYTKYLFSVFSEYNLKSDRSHRLDAHMKATGVHPSPSGLWNWGHQVGIGTQIHKDPSDLISSLLIQSTASITRHGLIFNRKQYTNRTEEEALEAEIARNSGGSSKTVFHYPGSLSRIWTPDPAGQGMKELILSDHSTASPETTLDEEEDAHAFYISGKKETNHESLLVSLGQMEERKRIVAEAIKNQKNSDTQNSCSIPSVTEARIMEKNSDFNIINKVIQSSSNPIEDKTLSKSHAEKLRNLSNQNIVKKSSHDE